MDSRLGRRSELEASILVDELWNLWPLAQVSSYLALGAELPEPWDSQLSPDYEMWSHYEKSIEQGDPVAFRSALLEDVEGLFVPFPQEILANIPLEPEAPLALTSLLRLSEELDLLAEALGVRRSNLDLSAVFHHLSVGTTEKRQDREVSILTLASRATELAVSANVPLYLRYEYPNWNGEPLSIYNYGLYGFDSFRRVSLSEDGSWLMLQFESLSAYRIPVEYLEGWFENRVEEDARLLHTAISLPGNNEFLLRYSDGEARFVTPEDVLKRCEPAYEEFGDISVREAERLRSWLDQASQFRVPRDV